MTEVIAKEIDVSLEAPQEVADFTIDVSEPSADFVIQQGEDTEAEFKVGGSTNFLLHYGIKV